MPLPDPAPDSEPLPDPLPDPDGQLAPPEPDASDPDGVAASLADPDCVVAALADPDPEALPDPPQSPKLRTSAPSSSPHAAPRVASASDSAVAVMMR